MKLETIIMMVIILGVTWGGFGYCIRLSMKREKKKKEEVQDKRSPVRIESCN
jgi:flagellar basal body-associated protein FliL